MDSLSFAAIRAAYDARSEATADETNSSSIHIDPLEDADIAEDLRALERCAETVRRCEEAGIHAVREVHTALQQGTPREHKRWAYAESRAALEAAGATLEKIEAAVELVRERRPMYINERTSPAALRYLALLKEASRIAAREQRRTMVRIRFIDRLDEKLGPM